MKRNGTMTADHTGKEERKMLRRARVISMIVLAASIVFAAGMAVENLILACIALSRKRERR